MSTDYPVDKPLTPMKNFRDHKRDVQSVLKQLQKLIDKLRVMEESILSQEEALYVISEFAYDWEYWRGNDGTYKYVSPSCKTLTGYTPEEFYQDKDLLQKIIVAKDWQKWQDHSHTMDTKNEMVPLEFEIQTKEGETKWIHHVCRTVINRHGEHIGIRGSNRDITDLKKLQHRLEHVAGHDNLTGLANRSLFIEHLKQRIKEARRDKTMFAVAFIDLDGFKHINDTLGHDAGDHVLQKVAADLQQNLRANDIIARFGGDEFVGLFAISKSGDAYTLKEKILGRIGTTIHCKKFQIIIRLSIGISIYPSDGTTMDALLNMADHAMYAMKTNHKKNKR